MRVVLDGVFNHTGRGFWPFHHVLETGPASPYRSWFHLDDARLDGGRPLVAYPPPGRPAASRRATRPGGGCRRCPSSTPTSQRSASTCWASRSTGSASGSTAGGWTFPARSTTRRSGRSSGAAAGRSVPTPTSSARSGASRPDWLRGDRFDALMNYPLAEAIIGFAAGDRLNSALLALAPRVLGQHPAARRPGVRPAAHRPGRGLRPRVVAVQLNLLGSHDTPRLRTCSAATRRASGWRRCSRRRCPVRRASTTATRSA